jgi:hypothetical protein
LSKHHHTKTNREGRAYPDGVVVVPSDLLGELTEKAVLVPRLQPQNPAKHNGVTPSNTDKNHAVNKT